MYNVLCRHNFDKYNICDSHNIDDTIKVVIIKLSTVSTVFGIKQINE